MQWNIFISNQKSAQLAQIDHFLDAEALQSLHIVPNNILDGISVVGRIKFDKSLAQQAIELIECLLGEATVENDADDFSLLGFLKSDPVQLLESLQVVVWLYNGLEDSLFHVVSHMVLFCNIYYFVGELRVGLPVISGLAPDLIPVLTQVISCTGFVFIKFPPGAGFYVGLERFLNLLEINLERLNEQLIGKDWVSFKPGLQVLNTAYL